LFSVNWLMYKNSKLIMVEEFQYFIYGFFLQVKLKFL